MADKDGILRFVGGVHFSSGVWCGVELFEATGKNDGSVRGVRYFQCPPCHGLMAPLAKVILTNDDGYDAPDDCGSGPYSILFGLDKEPLANSTFVGGDLEEAVFENSFSNKTDRFPATSIVFDETSSTFNKDTVVETTQILSTSDTEAEKEAAKFRGRRNTFTIDALNDVQNKTISLDEKGGSAKLKPLENNSLFENKSLDVDKTITNSDNKLNVTISKPTQRSFTRGEGNATYTQNNINRALQNTNNRTYQTEHISLDNNSKCLDRTSSLPKNINETFDKPLALRPLEFTNPPVSSLVLNKLTHSAPREADGVRKSNQNVYAVEDDANKRDSLDLEESLGILTPEQMLDATNFPIGVYSRTPSSENIRSLPHDSAVRVREKSLELPSPNLIDASLKDFSLGIIDENLLSHLRSDTTTNMELPLDSIGKSKDFTLTRMEQTPSPEELPLDPTPIVETDPKTDTSKSKTTSSFIASIASITSLDTGYQGDGEMSRPASRGADNSPMTRRPLPRPQPRRPDPMTDSDFYTESDADNHEDHPLRGDRRAQVIDGTLYGVDPQAAADIYVNNRENMDSSGIFTDIENTRADELSEQREEPADVSPSDSSTKTLSDNSQNNLPIIITKASTPSQNGSIKDTIKQQESASKRGSPTPASSSANTRSPRHVAKEDPKKHKMPKRNVASKVKAMIEPGVQKMNEVNNRTVTKTKTAGRWDAVMNKISKTSADECKNKLKDVKSKVFSGAPVPVSGQKPSDARKVNSRQTVSNQKTANVKT